MQSTPSNTPLYEKRAWSTAFFALLCVWTVVVTNLNGQLLYSTPAARNDANVTLCPFMLITPSLLDTYFGKKTVFNAIVEAKLDPPLESGWQYINYNNHIQDINEHDVKYSATESLPSPKLVINDVDFDDVGYYQLQVRIVGGWCTSNTVRLRRVWGILQYNDGCNLTRECDERRKNLQCSNSKCLCHPSYYHFDQQCFPKSNLGAIFVGWNITTSEINVKWRDPDKHSDLIQSYRITVGEYGGSTRFNTLLGRQYSYSSKSSFDPGHSYYFKITSNVQLSDPVEIIYVETQRITIVEPLPPGDIDRNASNFHPDKLHLKWTAPGNRTHVDRYRIYINGYHYYTRSTETTISRRLEPGRNYTVEIVSESYNWYYYVRSKGYVEQITTLRTPEVIITNTSPMTVPYLSTLEIEASVQNHSDFPPTLETRWQKNGIDINITDFRYNGSSLDLFNPKLVINRVDFEHENNTWYRCIAVNSDGRGRSTYDAYVYVEGSLEFLEPCNKSRECLPRKYLICSNEKCLCNSSYYHQNQVCYHRSNLQAHVVHFESSTCAMTITWEPPARDEDLVLGYQVITSEMVSVWNKMEYTTPCKLQPGLRYGIYIRSNIQLSDPKQEIDVDSITNYAILEPLRPGPILRSLSNFSADNLYLRWEASGQNSFVNRYRVTIGDRSQQTVASVPEIYWRELLLPVTLYNVTITAISYGYISNYPGYGSRESISSTYWIETTKSQYTAKTYMSYGDGDYVLLGDDVTSAPLRSPTTVYIGNGSDGGFNSVVIGTNGVIGLGETFNSINISEMDSSKMKEIQVICPFWTDLSSEDTGKVYYNAYTRGVEGDKLDSVFMEKADNIVKTHFRDLRDFKATWLVKVTWENMTLYGHKEKKATFQCLLISDGENTFAVISYIDVNLEPILNLKISIGYRYKTFLKKNSFTNQKGAFRMSTIQGNRAGERGFWIYKMTEGVRLKMDEKKCLLWHSYNIENQIRNELSTVLNDIECPCDPRLLRFDPRYIINRFDRVNRVLCYASMVLGTNVECCFKMFADTEHLGPLERSPSLAGTVVRFNPFFERYLYKNNDSKPREQCCSTGHCDLYYKVRPIPRCYWRSPFQPGINFGDPHITTLDGLDYTFNGYGEYTMIRINTGTTTFELQARTDLATTANGTTINATIFSAFVAQDQTGSKVQIEMSRNKTGMIIRVNGVDLTTKFKHANYTFRTPNVSLQWENQTISTTFLKPLITMKISLGKRFLICETLVNKKYKGLVLGLMGNFDGNKTNDFILPNGTVLKENATKTERGIFYNLGRLWSVDEKSTLFQYNDGLTYNNYLHPEFVPLFTDEVDTNRINEAKEKCGSSPSKACISDYLATGDITLAESSGNKEQDSKSDIADIENESPRISGNTTVHVIINKEVEMKFNASDDGDETPEYRVLNKPDNFVLDNETGIARWTPKNASVSEISIIAVDAQGAQSPSLDVSIIMCTGCSDRGECDYVNMIPTQNDRFHKAVCICNIGYSGDDCEKETDACLQSPCPLGRDCTDLSPEEEVRLDRGYNCSECPTGYTDVNNKCQDIDECAENNTCDATKGTCENTDGSYVCNCFEGYRSLNDNCNDIDECFEGTSGCQQLCRNTPGSYNCLCHPGFSLNVDKSTCDETGDDLCRNFGKECAYACSAIDGTTQCICPSGYHLANNGINCTDIDECALNTSPCDQECLNKNGSFQCACRPGYSLEADKTSCSICEQPYYGENCSQVCECGAGVDRCDPVSGCVCLQGWTGRNCSVDIDECQRNPFVCGTNRICQNTEGSYKCDCAKGFKFIDDKCEDIDECNDASLNDCPVDTTECKNTHGSYSCECKEGYQEKNSVCEDIDECKTSIHGCSQKCENADGGYSCLCFFGFTLKEDRKTCEKIPARDSCSLFPGLNCSYGCKQATHDDHIGICFCESGYKLAGDGKTCIDVDECKNATTCSQNCTNVYGSFTCGCVIGYSLQNDGKSCKECSEYFYGENCETPCKCGRGASVCHHVNGCICKPGWRGETCEEDIDECKSNPCAGEYVTCLNTPGSFQCQCITGFKNFTSVCEDIDECQDPLACHQKCTNFEGNYTCSCKDGYKLINTKDCQDIDECKTAECHQCSNRPGGFTCSCNDGYQLNATTKNRCYNIDECMENTHNCSQSAHCTDTTGRYNCSCFEGFEGNGYNCTACKVFTFGEQCSDRCTCAVNNTEECDSVTGECRCKTGWSGTTCNEDVDECKETTIKCDTNLYQTCINTPGSSHCECRYGGLNLSDCIRPEPSQKPKETDTKLRTEIRFDLNIPRADFLGNSKKWRQEFEKSLTNFYTKRIRKFSTVFILSIRLGSTIIDVEIHGTKTDTNDLEHDVATSSLDMLSGKQKVTVFDQDLNVLEIIPNYNNGTLAAPLTTASSPCDLFKSFEACIPGQKCDYSSGEPTCVKEKSDSDISTLIVILGVSIPLLITALVLIVICICYQKRSKTKENKENKLNQSRFNDIPDDSKNTSNVSNGNNAVGGKMDEGCSNPNYTWDSFCEKLQQNEEFRIKRPTVNLNRKYQF